MKSNAVPTIALFTVAAALCLAADGRAENWPHWRGPTNNGLSNEKGLPAAWSKQDGTNVLWRTPLPGAAGSTPIVWGDRLFLTSVDGENLVLLCLGAGDGKTKWRAVMSTGNKVVRDGEGNSASPSPSTDGKHVWAMMGDGKIGCY
ncbi:MAG: PQQ-binding-like beta-propeller repeat protein, partial [Planctomycetia bacterium]